MKAIILTSILENIVSTYDQNNISRPINCVCMSSIKRNLIYLKNIGIDELIIVEGYGLQEHKDVLKECAELKIGINIIRNPFYKCTNSLVELWMAISEIHDDVLIINWDGVLKKDTIESFIEFGDGESCFLIGKREATCEQGDMNICTQDRDIVKIDNLAALKNRILCGSIYLSTFRGSGMRLIRESIEEEIRTVGAKKKEFVSAFYRLIKKEHMVCKVKSLEIGEIFKIYTDCHRSAFKVRLIPNDRFGKSHRRSILHAVKPKGD